MPNIVIDFLVENKELFSTIDKLVEIGSISKEVADKWKTSTKSIEQDFDKLAGSIETLAHEMETIPTKIIDEKGKEIIKETVVVTDQLTKKTSTLKGELRQVKESMSQLEIAGKRNSNEFKVMAQRAGQLQDQLNDTSQRVKNLASDTRGLDVALSVASGIAGGFAVAQGAAALFGDENEEIQKTLLKVQAALAILNGLQAIAATVNKDSAASTFLSNVALKQGSVLQTLYAFAVGKTAVTTTAATIAARAFRTALLLTGIGAIVVLLTAAANAMGVFGDSIDDTTEDIEEQKSAQDKLNASLREQFEIQQQGRTSRIGELQREIDLRKSQGETAENLFKLENEQLDLEIQKQRVLANTLADGSQEQFTAQEDLKNLINDKYILAATILKKLQDDEKKAATDSLKTEKERLDDLKKIQEEQLKTRNEMLKASAIGTAEFFNQEARNVITAFQGVFDVLGVDFSAAYKENIIDPVLKLNEEYYEEINKRYDAQREIDKANAELEKQLQEEKYGAFLSIVSNGFAIINNLSTTALNKDLEAFQNQLDTKQISQEEYDKKVAAAKRKSAIQSKILAIANAGINIAASIVKTGAELGYPAAIPFQILAGVVGLAELLKIASTPIPQFAKGTKDAPAGWKWVGEKGPELIYDDGGYPILTNAESMQLSSILDKYNISMPSQDFGNMDSDFTSDFDYNKLKKAVSEGLKELPQPHIDINERGVHLMMKRGIDWTEYVDYRYSSK